MIFFLTDMIGKTYIVLEISNKCRRLSVNAIIYYNSTNLAKLHGKYQVKGTKKANHLVLDI